MKILIANMMSLFVWGGAEELAFHLQKNLIKAGHETEMLRIPFIDWPIEGIASQMMMVRAIEVANADRVIALKFPAYLIKHHHKTMWLLHQFRQSYDLFDAGQSSIPKNSFGDDIRSLVRNADNESFNECREIYTISEVTRRRLAHYNGIDSKVLIPPMNDPELFTGGELGDYIFAGGRVNELKRQFLLLKALKHTSKKVKLIIAGPPVNDNVVFELEKIIADFDLADRVKLDLRFLAREEYAEYVNGSAAIAYIPYDEDSLGYVTMEGATAGKALITTTDSGGVLGLVKNYQTGWVAEPSEESLASVMEQVFYDLEITKKYGEAAQAFWLSLGITWPNTIEALLR